MPIYMKYGTINGPVTGKYKGWILLHSCQFGVGRSIGSPNAGSAERGTSAPSIAEITVTKDWDTSSNPLFQESISGRGSKVIIEFVKSDKLQTLFLQVELEDAMVGSYSMSSNGDKPMESITINFTKATYKSTVAATPPATVTSP